MKFDKENLHHAYVCVGNKEQVLESVLSFVENELGLRIAGNPDIRVEQFESFGIDDARRLNSAQLKKPILGDRMIFVVTLDNATMEAQNSLLKMFEEPTDNTHFFIVSQTQSIFVPTLLSRVQLEEMKEAEGADAKEFANKFLSSTKSERIGFLKDVIDEKNKGQALNILNSLERVLYTKEGTKESDAYETINLCRRYINDRGASVKILMEYLALNV